MIVSLWPCAAPQRYITLKPCHLLSPAEYIFVLPGGGHWSEVFKSFASRSLASSVVALKELETGDYIWKVASHENSNKSFILVIDLRCEKRNCAGCSGIGGSSELTTIDSTFTICQGTTQSQNDFTRMRPRKCLGLLNFF